MEAFPAWENELTAKVGESHGMVIFSTWWWWNQHI